ncbi:MAG: DUF4332 domain-containing protein [Cyanobacteria bacterium P01_A01_bin.135]
MPASWPIENLPGIDAEHCAKLMGCGITTTAHLLRYRVSHQQRSLAARLRVHPQYLAKWIALADLAQLPAVGCQYCGLLLHAGITSPQQLAATPLGRLHRQLVKLHVATLQNRQNCPSLSEVQRWIQQAQSFTQRY